MTDPIVERIKFENIEEESQENLQPLFVPNSFSEYLGQKKIKEKIELYVKAAKQRSEAMDHILLFGPPGLGKTTLAKIIAKELGVSIKITSAPALEKIGDLVAILSSLEPREVLFIDEIHRLSKVLEETLYSAMESFFVDIIIGQGAGARTMQLPLNRFTLIGATTKTGSLSAPLQTRFGIVERLEFYESDELAEICMQNANTLGIKIDYQAALEIGQRSRGTPRICKRLVRRIRDYVQIKNYEILSLDVAKEALKFLNIDEMGFDPLDQKIITILVQTFKGGPVGLETLAAAAGEDKQTLEDYCEPYLIRMGILQKTTRGRKISDNKVVRILDGKIIISDEEQKNIFDL